MLLNSELATLYRTRTGQRSQGCKTVTLATPLWQPCDTLAIPLWHSCDILATTFRPWKHDKGLVAWQDIPMLPPILCKSEGGSHNDSQVVARMSPDGRKVDARVTFFHPCDLKTVKALYIGAQFELRFVEFQICNTLPNWWPFVSCKFLERLKPSFSGQWSPASHLKSGGGPV